jgi:hypothetical protein
MKNIPTFESFVNEAAKLKITYTPIEKKAYTTQKQGIKFSVKINNQTATGVWIPKYGDITNGVDINQLEGSKGRFYIFSTGGSSRSYPISAKLEKSDRQPKDLRFTGPYLDISKLKDTFIRKITQAIEKPTEEEKLTPEFLEYFGISQI